MTDSDELRVLLDSLPDTVILCRDDGVIYDCNNQSLELLGYQPNELIGQPVELLMPAHQHHNHQQFRQHYFQAPQRRLMNSQKGMSAIKKDGSSQPVSIALSPAMINARQMVIVSMRDNTAACEARQRERMEYQQVLERQRLEKLGMFSCGIAHDFKNLLTVVLGNVELLTLELPRNHPLLAKVHAIGTSATHLADLSHQILNFAGGHSSTRELVNINAAVEEICALLQVSLPEGIGIRCELARSLPLLLAAPTQLAQILLNLILNASEAIGDAAGTIMITTGSKVLDQSMVPVFGSSKSTIPGQYLFIEVSDDGCGLDQDCRDRMLDPFFTTKAGGKGLGLSVVASIVLSHDGLLAVSSKPGEGATFTVYFPQ